jgi:hypothetical protein
MTARGMLAGWAFNRGRFDLGATVAAAHEGKLGPANLRLALLATTGDTITVEVTGGTPLVDVDALVYVGGHGAYEIARLGSFPGPCWLLTLRAWPNGEEVP